MKKNTLIKIFSLASIIALTISCSPIGNPSPIQPDTTYKSIPVPKEVITSKDHSIDHVIVLIRNGELSLYKPNDDGLIGFDDYGITKINNAQRKLKYLREAHEYFTNISEANQNLINTGYGELYQFETNRDVFGADNITYNKYIIEIDWENTKRLRRPQIGRSELIIDTNGKNGPANGPDLGSIADAYLDLIDHLIKELELELEQNQDANLDLSIEYSQQ